MQPLGFTQLLPRFRTPTQVSLTSNLPCQLLVDSLWKRDRGKTSIKKANSHQALGFPGDAGSTCKIDFSYAQRNKEEPPAPETDGEI